MEIGIYNIVRWLFGFVIVTTISIGIIGIIYPFVLIASEDENGNHSAKTFFLNIASCLVEVGKIIVYVTLIFIFAWSCSFITQPPCVNLVKKTDDGYLFLSDTSMVCDSNDSTSFYTVKSLSLNDTPGRFTRCIHCGRIFKFHYRWLTEQEKRSQQINKEIASEIAMGLLVDPL